MATIKKGVKKAQAGMTMKQLIKKYPGTDTTAKGDTRYQEFNAYAPKKFLKKVADTDKAFDKKFGKGKPAMKMGGKVKRAQFGSLVKGALKDIGRTVAKDVEKSIPKKITRYSSEAEKIAAGYEPKMIGGGKNTAPGKYLSSREQRAKKDLQKAIAERQAREAKAASEKNAKSFMNESFSRSTQKNGGKTVKKSMRAGGKISKMSKKK